MFPCRVQRVALNSLIGIKMMGTIVLTFRVTRTKPSVKRRKYSGPLLKYKYYYQAVKVLNVRRSSFSTEFNHIGCFLDYLWFSLLNVLKKKELMVRPLDVLF